MRPGAATGYVAAHEAMVASDAKFRVSPLATKQALINGRPLPPRPRSSLCHCRCLRNVVVAADASAASAVTRSSVAASPTTHAHSSREKIARFSRDWGSLPAAPSALPGVESCDDGSAQQSPHTAVERATVETAIADAAFKSFSGRVINNNNNNRDNDVVEQKQLRQHLTQAEHQQR